MKNNKDNSGNIALAICTGIVLAFLFIKYCSNFFDNFVEAIKYSFK